MTKTKDREMTPDVKDHHDALMAARKRTTTMTTQYRSQLEAFIGAERSRTSRAVTVTDARNQLGWTGHDHLLDHRPLQSLIGRTYPSVAALRRAVDTCAASFPLVHYTDGQRRYRYDGSPSVPGQRVRAIVDLGAW